jgi:hypothetical protein
MGRVTQQQLLIDRLLTGWLDSLQAVTDCKCLKLTTRVNEPAFLHKIDDLGFVLLKRHKECGKYVEYKLVAKRDYCKPKKPWHHALFCGCGGKCNC